MLCKHFCVFSLKDSVVETPKGLRTVNQGGFFLKDADKLSRWIDGIVFDEKVKVKTKDTIYTFFLGLFCLDVHFMAQFFKKFRFFNSNLIFRHVVEIVLFVYFQYDKKSFIRFVLF